MRRRWLLAAVAAVAACAVGGVVARTATTSATAAADPQATGTGTGTSTATVDRGPLAAVVSVPGTLAYRARPDGLPYPVINQAQGTYTALPAPGDEVACGAELLRVDDRPVLLLCGAIPAYRDLQQGAVGNDVRQLNANLHELGADAAAGVLVASDADRFDESTTRALTQLQRDRGAEASGELRVDGAVVLPTPVRIGAVAGQLGGPARPGEPVLDATSDLLEVQVALEGSQQRSVAVGDAARIVLPSNASVTGVVDRLGQVARAPSGPGEAPGPATTSASIRLDDLDALGGLDQAPVQVAITTEGVADVLSVPIAAVVGRSGGGFAVEVVRADEQRELAPVELGLVDDSAGRVQVDGEVREGDLVVVPGP